MVRRHYFNRIQVFLILQQFTEVGIGGATFESLCSSVVCIISVDNFSAYFPASGTTAVSLPPRWLA